MTLCGHRPDGGFGPHVHGTSILSTCFDDVILIPLGPWLFLVGAAVLAVLFAVRRPRSAPDAEIDTLPSAEPKRSALGSSPDPTAPHVHPRSRARLALLILSGFFAVALLAMHSLEIARLVRSGYGVGLLPFCYVPLVLVLLSLSVTAGGRKRGSVAREVIGGWGWKALVGVWGVWMAVTEGVKLWSLHAVQQRIGVAAYDVGSTYPYADRVTDVAVMVAVYVVLVAVYLPAVSIR